MAKNLLVILVGGLVGIIWFYIVARIVTRAVMRTLREGETDNEQKIQKYEEKAKP